MSPTPQRVVLITGCSTGVGRVTAEHLLRRGHLVYPTARRADSVAELREAFTQFGQAAAPLRLDVNDSETGSQVIAEIVQRRGRIDAVVNNAAYGQAGAVEELEPDDLRRQFDTNVVGLLELTRQALVPMRAARFGRIVNVSSVVAHLSLPLMGAYNASKAALNALSQSMRMELRGAGIDVILVEPGAVKSAFRENAFALLGGKADDPHSPYARHYAAWHKRWKHQLGAHAAPTETVARAIAHAVESPRPRPRYRLGATAKFAPLAYTLLPDRLVDWIIMRSFKML